MLSLLWPLTSVVASVTPEVAEVAEAVDTCRDGTAVVIPDSLGLRLVAVKLGVPDVNVAEDV